jgi:hypothetical protein
MTWPTSEAGNGISFPHEGQVTLIISFIWLALLFYGRQEPANRF